MVTTGFTPWPGPAGAELAPEIAAYLDDGAPPVLVTMGTSTATIAGPMLRNVAIALERLGLRGVFLVGTHQNERALDDIDGVFRFAPLTPVLDRCQAVVHQGGHGTVTATLHAGLPSVALPMGFDQIVHRRRLQELGIGTMVPARSRSTDILAAAVEDVIDDETAARAHDFATGLRSEDGTLKEKGGQDTRRPSAWCASIRIMRFRAESPSDSSDRCGGIHRVREIL